MTILSAIWIRIENESFKKKDWVARLAMFVDKNIINKKSIIKEIKVHQSFHGDNDKVDSLQKRYDNLRNIYSSNKKNSTNFL